MYPVLPSPVHRESTSTAAGVRRTGWSSSMRAGWLNCSNARDSFVESTSCGGRMHVGRTMRRAGGGDCQVPCATCIRARVSSGHPVDVPIKRVIT